MLHSSRFTGHGFVTHPLDARGVEPLELTLSRDATILHDRFAQEMAQLAGPGKRYGAPAVTEVAKKTAERALRFAGVLYAVDAFSAPLPPLREGYILANTERRLQPYEIGVDVMERAIALARWFLEEERRYYLALTQVPESKAERMFLDWLRRTIEGKTAGKWRPIEGAVEISKKVTCNGWLFAKDDRKGSPSWNVRPRGKKHPERSRRRLGQHVRGHVDGDAAALLPARRKGRTRAESSDLATRYTRNDFYRLSEDFYATLRHPHAVSRASRTAVTP